ncbi:sensor histidine kinase [Paenibacillus sp. HB172176]|uniref:cache domain-containing sensor histidine kinase n=1 Tax=Paenibacillus sp. HB172176 TaxID=2493690 RepID=UPI001F0FA557|nr:sensor histidine kinase [Paenibacillus sp. HB172176]
MNILSKEAIHRFSIPRPWLIAYLLLIVVPAAIFLYGYYERSASILKNEVVRTMHQALKQAGSNLSYRIERIEDISDAAFMNVKLYEYLSIRPDDRSIGTQIEVIKDLRYLVDTVQSNSDVFHMRLFVDQSKVYSGERINFFSLDSLKDDPWYPAIIDAGGGIVWSGVYEENFLDVGNAEIISAARMMRDPDHYDNVIGVLMIDIQARMVSDILSTLQFSPGTQVYLVDSNGIILYHPDPALIGTRINDTVAEVLQGSEGTSTASIDAEVNDIMYTTLPQVGWRLIAQGTESQLSPESLKQTKRSEWTSIVEYSALFLLLPFVLLAIIVRGMNRRVNHVITAIRRESKDMRDGKETRDGGLNELPQVNGDFHMLERSVDHLILRVRTLVEEKYTSKIHEREAQLQALQAQINPHFLYNTLDTINWTAIGMGATEISQMIDNLAKYFRLSLNKGKSVVSVSDELQLAEVYLEIQQSRFLNTFDFELRCEPGLESQLMPKLILQPIVENALLHGIRKAKDRRGRIVINAKREQDDLLFTIEDNGIGMEDILVQQLLTVAPHEQSILRGSGNGSSYGLYNVNERIKLYAGESYGISISSLVGVGTVIAVRLKLDMAE